MKGIPFSVGRFLEHAITRVRRIYLIRGIAAVGIVWILGIVAVMTVDSRIVIFDDRVRWAMTAGVWLLALLAAMWAIVRPLRRRLDFRRLAGILDRRHPEQEERLSTLVELAESDSAKAGFSASLFALVCDLAEDDVAKLDFRREFPMFAALRRFGVFALLALALGVGSAVSPNLVGLLFVRAVAPWADIGNLFSDEISVKPGDITILSGSVIRIEATADSPRSIRISRKRPHGWSEETVEEMAGGVYETTADLNEREWRYRVTAGHAVTRYHYVRVSQMPRYDLFTATVDYPVYTRMKPLVLTNSAVTAITAIQGSRVKFDVKVSDPGTLVDFRIGKEPVLEHTMVSNRTVNWSLDLVNEDGFRAEKGRHPLTSFIDQPPTVLIEKPTGTLRLPPHAKIPVEITASDDIGIADAYFRVSIDDEPWAVHYGTKIDLSRPDDEASRPHHSPNPTFLQTVADVDLSFYDLVFAKNIRFDVVVTDACPPELGGPHSATSTPFTVQFAADEATYAIQELKHEVADARRDIEEARKRLTDAQNLARQVRDELRRDPKPSTATEERSERLAHELQEAEKRVSELRDEFLPDERFAPLARPLERILDETLKPLLEDVEGTQFMDRNERADAVNDALPEMAKAAQELSDFSERLTERADKVDAFEKAKDLAARQDALAKAAEELTRERPLDTAKLEAWKRLEEAAMRKADELARQDPDSDIAEAKRKMESAAREMAQLKAEIEAAAAESNRLAKAADEQRKNFQDQQQRQAQEIAQAVADQQRALDALSQTNLAAAAQSQQAAKAHLQKADSLPAVKALQDLANEAAKLSAENKAQNRGEAESFPLQNKANDLAQSLQNAAAEAAKAEQSLREALAKALESNNPTNRTIEQSLDALDRKLRAELPKQRAALDAAKAADAENGRNAQLGSAAEDQKRALEALEKGDVPAAEAAQREAEEHLAKGEATPSVKALQKSADEAARNAEGTPRDSAAMELAKAEQRVAAKALEQEKAIREAIARGEKSEADLDAFDKSFRDQIRAKAADQAAAAEKKLTPDQVKRDEAQRQAEAKLLAQAAAEQKKAAEELAKGKPQSAAVAQREAETKLSQGHATEGTQRLQQAAGKADEAAAKSAAQRPDQPQTSNLKSQTLNLPSLKNAQAAQKAAAEALDRERALREAMKKGEASSAELDALDRANRAAADEAEKNLEAAKAADKVADLATAADAQAAAQKALDAVAANRAAAAEERRSGKAESLPLDQKEKSSVSPLDAKHRASLAEKMKAAEKAAKEAAAAQKQADDLLKRGEATEGVKAMQQLAQKAAAASEKTPHDVDRARRAAAAQQAAAKALGEEKALREAMESGRRTAADLEAFDRATRDEAAEQTAAFDRAEQAAAARDKEASGENSRAAQDLAQAVADQNRALAAMAQKDFKRAAEAQRSAEDRLERNEATEGVKALQQLATTAARNARKAPQTQEKFDLAKAAQKAATEALQNELKIREGIRKGEMTEADLAALDDQLKDGLLKMAEERTAAAKTAAAEAVRKARDVIGTDDDDQLAPLADAALEAARDAVSSQLSESKLKDDDARSAALRDAEDALDAITAEAADEQAVEDRIRGLQKSAAEALSRNDRARALNLQKEIASAQARATDSVNEEDEKEARAAANAAQAEAAEAVRKAYGDWNNNTKEAAIAAQKAAAERELEAQSEARRIRALSKLHAAEKSATRKTAAADNPSTEQLNNSPDSSNPQTLKPSNSQTLKPSETPDPSEAAEAASDALDREVNAQAAALGMSKRSAQSGAKGKGGDEKSKGGGGGVKEEVKKLANDLKRNDSPDFLKSLFSRLGWFKIRGLSRDGLGTPDLKDVPREYRDLVRRYFLKLSEEQQ